MSPLRVLSGQNSPGRWVAFTSSCSEASVCKVGSAVSFAVSVLSSTKAFAGGRCCSHHVPIHPHQGEFTSPSVLQPAFALICQQSPADFTHIHKVPGSLQLGSVGMELGELAAHRCCPWMKGALQKAQGRGMLGSRICSLPPATPTVSALLVGSLLLCPMLGISVSPLSLALYILYTADSVCPPVFILILSRQALGITY